MHPSHHVLKDQVTFLVDVQHMAHGLLSRRFHLNLLPHDVAQLPASVYHRAKSLPEEAFIVLDLDTFVASAKKTGRVVIADESYPRCGMAADFSALITENAFTELKAPVMRVIPPHTPIPFCGPLEDEWVPDVDKIVEAVKNILNG